MMVVVSFYLSIYQDLEKVKKLLHEVVITSRFAYLEKPTSIIFEELPVSNNFVIKTSIKVYVLDVKYEKALMSDITIRGSKILAAHNIERPVVN